MSRPLTHKHLGAMSCVAPQPVRRKRRLQTEGQWEVGLSSTARLLASKPRSCPMRCWAVADRMVNGRDSSSLT